MVYYCGECGDRVREAVLDLRAKMQRERDLKREATHHILIVALHTDSLWEK